MDIVYVPICFQSCKTIQAISRESNSYLIKTWSSLKNIHFTVHTDCNYHVIPYKIIAILLDLPLLGTLKHISPKVYVLMRTFISSIIGNSLEYVLIRFKRQICL